MATDDRTADEVALRAHADSLADGIEAALPAWVEAAVERRMLDWQGSLPPELADVARVAGASARDEIGPEVKALLALDVDDQRSTPLAVVRTAVRFPTAVLRGAGVPPMVRDPMAESAFPEDVYDLTPGAFSDLAPALAEPGLVWGAAKAHVILSRRRAEGRR